jgi:small subunit ribosomal protein S20
MANHPSAAKRARQSVRRATVNRLRRSRVKTSMKKVEAAIAGCDKETARAALKAAQPEMHRAVTKGVMQKNAVARKLSRLSARIKSI